MSATKIFGLMVVNWTEDRIGNSSIKGRLLHTYIELRMTSIECYIGNLPDTYRKDLCKSLETGKFHSMANDLNYSPQTWRLVQFSIGYLGDTLIPFALCCCCDIYLQIFLLTLTDFGICTCNNVHKCSNHKQ